MGKLFDLHFEIGSDATAGTFYCKTILGGPNGVMFEKTGQTPAHAVTRVVEEMEASDIWHHLVSNPQIATYPFTQMVKTFVAADPNAPKKRPSDIHTVPHPHCTTMCQAYDNFLDAKCKSICGHRKGI